MISPLMPGIELTKEHIAKLSNHCLLRQHLASASALSMSLLLIAKEDKQISTWDTMQVIGKYIMSPTPFNDSIYAHKQNRIIRGTVFM